MKYQRALGAEFREVHDRTRNGQPVRAILGSRVYRTDRDDLWNALTDRERLPRWFAPVSGELQLGGRYKIEGNAEGSILLCAPPGELELTWEFAGNVSWVRVTLDAESEGTRLTLEHSMAKDQPSDAHWVKYGPGATGVGWDLSFLGLALHIDSGGGTVDQEENTAWLTSDTGRAFLRTSAGHWGQAHISAGEDPSVAEEMAKRTGDFYTGS